MTFFPSIYKLENSVLKKGTSPGIKERIQLFLDFVRRIEIFSIKKIISEVWKDNIRMARNQENIIMSIREVLN